LNEADVMKCYFYLQVEGAEPARLGPFEAVDDADARGLAQAEMARRPHVISIDIWCGSGELYRVERAADATDAAEVWAKAFRGAAAQRLAT
jgi:hypothetical protein